MQKYFPMPMHKIALRLCLALSIACLSTVAHADKANKETVIKLWNATNMDALLDNIKASLFSGKQNLLEGLAKENASKVKEIVEKDFKLIKPHMQGFMIQRGNSIKLTQAYKWIATPLGQKIGKLRLFPQILFSDPEVPIPVKSQTLSRDREALKKKFEGLMFAPNTRLNEVILAHYLALENQTRAPDKRLLDVEVKQQTRLATVKISGLVQQVIPHTFDRNFADLSLEEVTVVMNFIDSQAGKSYTDLLVDAFDYAITQTQPKALLAIADLYEDELSILSPHSKKTISDAQVRELMALLINQHGKANVIRAMVEARNGEMTIIKDGEERTVFGRPNQKLVTIDTLLRDLTLSRKDIREFYKILQKKLRN